MQEGAAVHAHPHPDRAHRATHGAGIAGRISAYRPHAASTLIYLIIAMIVFWPVASHINSVVPGFGGDSFQNLWFLWWTKYAVFNLHANPFTTMLLYWPVGANLAFQTTAPLLGILSAPFQGFGVPFAYNLAFLFGFAFSGLGMFILADYIVKDRRAAFIAGLIFAFSAFHIAQAGHIHFINIEWAPLFVYFLLRVIEERGNYWNVLGMALTLALSTLTANIEVTIIIALMLPIVIIYYIAIRGKRARIMSRWAAMAIPLALLLALLFGIWNYLPIINEISRAGLGSANFLNTQQNNIMWSDNLLAFFLPSYYNGFAYASGISKALLSSIYAFGPAESTAYIGYSVLLLALYGIYKKRGSTLLWIFGAVVSGWLALGPSLMVGSSITGIPGLYSIYHSIAYANVVREPGRFQLLFTMCVAVLAAFGTKELLARLKADGPAPVYANARQIAILSAISLIILFEIAGIPLGGLVGQMAIRVSVPRIYPQLANLTGNFSVLELPALPISSSAYPSLYIGADTYYTSVTRKPLVGGYLRGANLTQTLSLYDIPLVVQDYGVLTYGKMAYSSPVLENYTNQTLLTLYNYNTAFVILQKDAYNNTQLNLIGSYLYGLFGAPVYDDNTTLAFSTASAINKTLYRSYVAYPVLSQWNESIQFVNGSYITMWSPAHPGAISVFAPYANRSATLQEAYSQGARFINTTISFDAMSQVGQRLYIAEPTSQRNYTILGNVSIGPQLRRYSINTSLVSGPRGSTLFFINQYKNYAPYMQNITFAQSG